MSGISRQSILSRPTAVRQPAFSPSARAQCPRNITPRLARYRQKFPEWLNLLPLVRRTRTFLPTALHT